MKQIKKAIVPVAGLGTRFLPMSTVMPKELLPLVDKPILQYIVEEAVASGIEEIIFVSRAGKEMIFDYFSKDNEELKKLLEKRKKNKILEELENFSKLSEKLSISNYAISQVFQNEPLGDGHAILQAKEELSREASAVLFGDDVVESSTPCLAQLIDVYKEYNGPVLALHRVPKDRIDSYGVVRVEKIKDRVYKIKEIVEKPNIDEAPSDLAVVGKYILTPEVFNYLSVAEPKLGGEIILAETLEKMIQDGIDVYGCEFEGEWLECGNKTEWISSNLYLSLKDPRFASELKKIIEQKSE
jgi:UTP--glucose-1-phosphate uridylyltransferase